MYLVHTHSEFIVARKPGVKVPKTFRLDPRKITAAQRILGAKTQTEAIEEALDMIIFRERLVRGNEKMFGIHIDLPDDNDTGA